MAIQPKDKKEDKEKKNPALKADPETLHTTDPQEEMKGPLSSGVQNIKDKVNKNDNESKKEADNKKRQEYVVIAEVFSVISMRDEHRMLQSRHSSGIACGH